jgi:putative endonuclease
MPDPRRARGEAGEQAAADLLAQLGYDIVGRNFRTRYGELDVIAADGDCLVFCEVRARVGTASTGVDAALESIGPGKRLQLRKMAREWFRAAGGERRSTRYVRFDAIAVALSRSGAVLALRHVRDAF